MSIILESGDDSNSTVTYDFVLSLPNHLFSLYEAQINIVHLFSSLITSQCCDV